MWDEEVLAEDPLDDLEVLVWIVGLTECLLAGHLAVASEHALWSRSNLAAWVLSRIHGAPIVESLLLLPRAFLEEHFPEHILLLLVRVVVLHVVVVGLVKDTIGVVIAVWVLISNPSSLTH